MAREYKEIEAPFTVKLKVWMKYNMKFTYGWEAKYPKTKNYIFASDKSFAKELRNLLIWYRTLIYKFSDVGRMGTIHDGFTIWNEKSYFFITWNGKRFYAIESTEIQKLIDTGIKSLDEGMANVIAYLVDEVK